MKRADLKYTEIFEELIDQGHIQLVGGDSAAVLPEVPSYVPTATKYNTPEILISKELLEYAELEQRSTRDREGPDSQ